MDSIDEFTRLIDADLAWRKREVSNLILLENPENQLVIIKSTLLLIYSHWEGYIKNASKLYLIHVSRKNLDINQLTDNFKAISLKNVIAKAYESCDSLSLSNELNFLDKMKDDSNKKFRVSREIITNERDKSIINTKDNLSIKVFKSILKIVGIDYQEIIDTKRTFIDEKLLENRNKVAHGNRIESVDDEFNVNIDELKTIKNLIFYLMGCFADDLKFFVENELYFIDKSDDTQEYLELKREEIRDSLP
ncbi:MAE_28990/MAE_18760 family HEPN-like nuclease [uncultured Pseudoteredinibacter sp.]|uniref:MAE_28990/MAE_18760 family HEPN-like nuclease n=1 Tax=uncultured Pseudoteredinibacter sp. TaxID=1641701 RepID=UPI00260AE479|nr:MAE_28990/MAE_18760 family HEPN-like nuclease [uncultured Pseudoteredinibacter sp.]